MRGEVADRNEEEQSRSCDVTGDPCKRTVDHFSAKQFSLKYTKSWKFPPQFFGLCSKFVGLTIAQSQWYYRNSRNKQRISFCKCLFN